MPAAPTFEYAVGSNDDSTCGSAASSRRQPALREHFVDVRLPSAGADEALAEPIGLAELEAQPARGGTELGVARALGEQLQHSLFLVAQILAGAAAELRQNRCASLPARARCAGAARACRSFGDAHGLIDDVHAQRVVDEAFARVDLGVDARPELDCGLELRGPRKQLVLRVGAEGDGGRRRRLPPRSDMRCACSGFRFLRAQLVLDYVHRGRRPSRT